LYGCVKASRWPSSPLLHGHHPRWRPCPPRLTSLSTTSNSPLALLRGNTRDRSDHTQTQDGDRHPASRGSRWQRRGRSDARPEDDVCRVGQCPHFVTRYVMSSCRCLCLPVFVFRDCALRSAAANSDADSHSNTPRRRARTVTITGKHSEHFVDTATWIQQCHIHTISRPASEPRHIVMLQRSLLDEQQSPVLRGGTDHGTHKSGRY